VTISKIKLLPRSTLTAKVRTGFAGSVAAGSGATVTHVANVYTVSFNPVGLGLVAGPVTSVDNAIVRFNGTGGNVLQDSLVTINDAGVIVTQNGAGLQVGSSVPFSDVAGALTLQNVDAIDTTTRRTVFSPYTYLFELTDDDGVSDQSANLQSQIDYCKAARITHARFPPYGVRAKGLTVDFPLMIDGSPPQIAKGDLAQGLPGDYGSYIIQRPGDTASSALTFLEGCNGGGIRNVGFWQEHDADAPGFVPTDYPACVLVYGAASILIDNLTFYCSTGSIRACNSASLP
jgi:hypothetical protein